MIGFETDPQDLRDSAGALLEDQYRKRQDEIAGFHRATPVGALNG